MIFCVNRVNTNIAIPAANDGKRGFMILKDTKLRAIKKTRTEDKEIINDASATPLYPYKTMNKGLITQVKMVQKIIKYNVIFTFPIAFKILVSGVDKDDITVLREKKVRERIAGSHLLYSGKKATK